MALSPRRETQHTISSKIVACQALLVVVAVFLGYSSASAAPSTTPRLDSEPPRAPDSGTPTDVAWSSRQPPGGSGQVRRRGQQSYHTRQPRKHQVSSHPRDADQSSAPIIVTSAPPLGTHLDTRRLTGNRRDGLGDGTDSKEGSAPSGFATVAALEAGEGYGRLKQRTGLFSSRRKRGKKLRGSSDSRRRRRRSSDGQKEAGLLELGLNQVKGARSLQQEVSRSTVHGESQHAAPSSSAAKTHQNGDKDEPHVLHSAYGRSNIARRPPGLTQGRIALAREAMWEDNGGGIDQHWLRFLASWRAGERSTIFTSRRQLKKGGQNSPSNTDDDTPVDDDTLADDDASSVAEDSFGSVGLLAFLVCFGLMFCVMEGTSSSVGCRQKIARRAGIGGAPVRTVQSERVTSSAVPFLGRVGQFSVALRPK